MKTTGQQKKIRIANKKIHMDLSQKTVSVKAKEKFKRPPYGGGKKG